LLVAFISTILTYTLTGDNRVEVMNKLSFFLGRGEGPALLAAFTSTIFTYMLTVDNRVDVMNKLSFLGGRGRFCW
jgi:hypothetical protein